MADWQRTSPLHNVNAAPLSFESATVTLAVPAHLNKLKVQCRMSAGVDLGVLETMVGAPLPGSPAERIGTDPAVFWTAPGEWLVVSPNLDVTAVSLNLASALTGTLHTLTDVSDSLAVIEIRGPRAPELLSEGCGVDLHEKHFPAGRYALTRLEQQAVIIHHVRNEPAYHVYVDRNAARYLWDWLEDGAKLMASSSG